MAAERLQKVLAAAGVASRRGAEALIEAGRVTVDGRPAVIGEQVDPLQVSIAVDGRPIGGPSTRLHLAVHKPPGVTSTVRDRHAARTVIDLVPPELRPRGTRLYPVGRLDLDSEGLLLLTNDGTWADRILHPRHEVEREYAIAIRAPLDRRQAGSLHDGIELDEGLATLAHLRPMTDTEVRGLAALIRPPPDPDLAWYRATLRQGWKRQLRRMFGAIGAPVARLVRVRVGSVRLDGLPSGAVRSLDPGEVRGLAGGGGRRGHPERPASVPDGPDDEA
jgi:23S rRNA pseudouridine2605 synthase